MSSGQAEERDFVHSRCINTPVRHRASLASTTRFIPHGRVIERRGPSFGLPSERSVSSENLPDDSGIRTVAVRLWKTRRHDVTNSPGVPEPTSKSSAIPKSVVGTTVGTNDAVRSIAVDVLKSKYPQAESRIVSTTNVRSAVPDAVLRTTCFPPPRASQTDPPSRLTSSSAFRPRRRRGRFPGPTLVLHESKTGCASKIERAVWAT